MDIDHNPWLEMGRLSDRLSRQGRRDLWATIAMAALVAKHGLGGETKLDSARCFELADAMEKERSRAEMANLRREAEERRA